MAAVEPTSATLAYLPPVVNSPLNAIQEACRRQLFHPYKNEIEQFECWLSWFDRINKIASGEMVKDHDYQESLGACYLFAVAIDPTTSVDQKRKSTEEYLNSLSEDSKNYLLALLPASLPAVMTTHILLYCADEPWHYVLCQLFAEKDPFFLPPALQKQTPRDFLVSFMIAVSQSRLHLADKQTFFDQLFDALSEVFCFAEQDVDMFFYFFLKASRDDFVRFQESCSDALRERFADLLKSTQEYGPKLQQALEKKPAVVELPFKSRYQRGIFDSWFQEHALNSPQADLIAIGMQEHHFASMHLPAAKVMEWMQRILFRLQDGSLVQAGGRGPHTPLWQFLRNASSYIQKQKEEQKEECDIACVARLLTGKLLAEHHDAFAEGFFERIFNELLSHEPQTIVSWLETLLSAHEVYHRVLDKIALLIERVLPVIHNDVLLLTIYASLDTASRKKILAHLFKERDVGIQTISRWVDICLREEKGLKPFVKSAFGADFYLLLQSLDPDLPAILKEALLHIENSAERAAFVSLLLPTHLDMKNPTVRQRVAIEKLKLHFLAPSISFRERWHFIDSIRVDLEAGLTPRALAYLLADKLPHETRPLLFAHFGNSFCLRPYDEYLAKKIPGGLFSKVRKDLPPAHEYQDASRWIELAASTLDQLFDNPSVLYGGQLHDVEPALDLIYHVACENNTIYQVVTRFLEIAPRSRVIPTLNLLGKRWAASNNLIAYFSFLLDCIAAAKFDKVDFIASCILPCHPMMKDHRGQPDLYESFWYDDFVDGDEETAKLTKKVIELTGASYVERFHDSSSAHAWMIVSLAKTDRPFCARLFYQCLEALCQSKQDSHFKVVCLHNLVRSYKIKGADFSFHELFANERAKPLMSEIAKWYTQETVTENVPSTILDWYMVEFFHPPLLNNFIMHKVRTILSRERSRVFPQLHIFLDTLENRGKRKGLISDLLLQEPEFLSKVRALMNERLIEALSHSLSHLSFELVVEFVPDWSDQLLTWVKSHGRKEKRTLDAIVETLSKVGKLEDWLRLTSDKMPPRLRVALRKS